MTKLSDPIGKAVDQVAAVVGVGPSTIRQGQQTRVEFPVGVLVAA
jgi:hypothetical protein